jgi:aryl-alcohol dehydrogenase-like predicted oxidoreductase
METTQLGKTTQRISRLGLGGAATGGHGWGRFDDDDSRRAIALAFESGVTFFDTADVYGLGHAEEVLSDALGPRRHDVVIATKFGVRWDNTGRTWKDVSPTYLQQALDASLRRLRVDCIPLYYVHWPDGVTPLEETLAALERCRQAGKIRWIGLSNRSAEDVLRANRQIEVTSVQVRYNLLDRAQAESLVELAALREITLVTWGSLAEGLLTGKFSAASTFELDDRRNRYVNFRGTSFTENLAIVQSVREVATRLEKSSAQVALRWLLDTSGVGSVLFGAKTPRQVEDNLGALDWSLSPSDYALLESLNLQRAA